jgi:mycothiol synthase
VGWVVPRHDDLTVDLPYRRRGHGTRLVAAGRLLEAAEGHDHLRLWVPHRADAEGFARAAGLAYDSSLWKLRLDPSVDVTAASFPEDVVVRWIERGSDDARFVGLVNTTFEEHPSPIEVDLATIERVHGRRDFDPSSILLVSFAADPDHLIGFCRVGTYADDDGRLVGEVKHVGVRREARGRGLGRELVRWGIAACRERGVEDVYLSVESENRGALGLYESLGFRPDVEWPHWTIAAR